MKGCEEKDEAMESDIDMDEKDDNYMGQGPAEQEEADEPEQEEAEEPEETDVEKESPHPKS